MFFIVLTHVIYVVQLLKFLIVFLLISGSWFGFWAVRKLVLTEDGSIDAGVSHFVTWAIRVVASVLILQVLFMNFDYPIYFYFSQKVIMYLLCSRVP